MSLLDNTPKKYKVGDFVLIKNVSEPDKKLIGRIEELIPNENPSETLIRYNQYLFPEDTVEGRHDYNSKNEIYKTNEIEKEYYNNIISTCEVVSYEIYLQQNISKPFATITQSSQGNSNQQNQPTKFFYRQLYSIEDESYIPDLDTSCYCKKIFNPDIEYSQCKMCKYYYHNKCLNKSESKKCPNPKCNNKLESKLTFGTITSGINSTHFITSQILNKKRTRNEAPNNSSNSNKKLKMNKEQYRNLPEDSRKYLINLVDMLEKKNQMLMKTLNEPDKMRKNAYEKILHSLLYGIEELKTKSKDFWKVLSSNIEKNASNPTLNSANSEKNTLENLYNLKNINLNSSNINNNQFILKYCRKLSIEIECLIYLTNKETTSNYYKKKFLILFSNLIDERNSELRQAVLLHEITPMKLINMSNEELAPSSVKKRRVEQQNKYFKEQVFMEEDKKLIANSHKGYSLLSVDPMDKNTGGLNPFEILESNNKKEKEKGNKNINPINSAGSIINVALGKINEKNEGLNVNKSGIINKDGKGEQKNQEGVNNEGLSGNISGLGLGNGVAKGDKDKGENEVELKYQKLSSDKLKFYLDLNEYKTDKIINKLNDEIKINLKSETIDEIKKIRDKINKKE